MRPDFIALKSYSITDSVPLAAPVIITPTAGATKNEVNKGGSLIVSVSKISIYGCIHRE
jgi:hypothetical protein